MTQVALITGGASGMGLQVATDLATRGGWILYLLDVNEEAGQRVARSFGNIAHFHKVDVTSYLGLSSTFDNIFKSAGRMDFVYANAGIKESGNIYEVQRDSRPPPPINQLVVDINLTSVINTSYLAAHYFRLSPHKGQGASLVITASAGSLYSLDSAPMYAAAKFGVLGFMWSIAKQFKKQWGIRVNAVLPGPVATNLVQKEIWAGFNQDYLTHVTEISNVVLQFVEGKEMTDANGVKYTGDQVFGRAAEAIQKDFFFRTQHEWSSDAMKMAMAGNDL